MDGPRVAELADLSLVAGIAARGFFADPVMTWVFPDPDDRPEQLNLAFTGLAYQHLTSPGLVHVLDDACASFWRPPAYRHRHPVDDPDGDGGRSPADGDGPPSPFGADVMDRFARLGAAMTAAHPEEPHWYLGVLSTVPERQSQGLGALTMTPVLADCDAQGLPAYLESSNERNIPFYWRLGFEPTGEIRVADGPTLYPMWRKPRPL